jgi:hypothetical protein
VYGPWTGTWNFYGSLISNTCPPGSSVLNLADTFYVVQSGTSFAAEEASLGTGVVFTGSMDSDGGFTIVADGVYLVSDPVCVFNQALTVSPVGTVIEFSDPAGVAITTICPTYSCVAEWAGSVTAG